MEREGEARSITLDKKISMEIQQRLASQFKTMKLVHFAILLGTLMFLVIARFVLEPESDGEDSIMRYIGAGLIVIGFISSYFIRDIFMRKARDSHDLRSKLNNVFIAHIISWTIIEFATSFCIIMYILYGGLISLLAALIGIFILYLSGPKLKYIKEHIDIN